MRQAILKRPGCIEVRQVPDITAKDIADNEVLINIHRIGVCGSEIHSYHGQHPATVYPVVQGHEYSGTVTAVGPKVTGFHVGDKVTARPQETCGKCGPCRSGRYNICSNLKVEAFQADGAAQDYFAVPQDRVVLLPDDMSFDFGAMIEPAAVAAHVTTRSPKIAGANVVVSGAGTIGNLVAQFALARGARKVLITDVSGNRLAIAGECGIPYTANVAEISFGDAVERTFGEEGFQVGIECAGVESSVRNLMEYIEKGGDVIIVGVHAKDPAISMFYLGEHELNLIGSMMYLHEDYLKAVEEVSKGTICLEPLISNRFPLEEYNGAYQFIDSGKDKCMKVIIDLDMTRDVEKKKLVSIGELLWDVLPSGKQLGGAPANFAYWAGKNGCRSSVISAIGNDSLGDEIIDCLRDKGLDLSALQRNEKPTGTVNVTIAGDGQPSYEICEGVAWDYIEANPEALSAVSDADAVCWGSLAQRTPEGREAVLKLVDSVREDCMKIFDINLRQHYYDPATVGESLKRADILKLNEDELPVVLEMFALKDIKELIGRFSLRYVIFTSGAARSEVYGADGEYSCIPTPKVEVVSTVGAGDSFTATFVSELFRGSSVAQAHRKAVEVSADVCRHAGAMC